MRTLATTVLMLALLTFAASPTQAAGLQYSYDDLFKGAARKTAQAVSHESVIRLTIDGIPPDSRRQFPGAPASGPLTFMDVSGQFSGDDLHVFIKGSFAAMLSADLETGMEMITAGGHTYLHGPLPSLGAPEDRWYQADELGSYGTTFEDLAMLDRLSNSSLKLSKLKDEALDGVTCGVYSASDRKAVETALGALFGSSGAGSQIAKPELRFWICNDGYVHQAQVTFDLDCTCDDGGAQARMPEQPEQLAAQAAPADAAGGLVSYALLLRYANMNRQIVIKAPTDAIPLEMESEEYGMNFATVYNGGNIRQEPSLKGKVLGQLHAGQTVILLERTPDSAWFRVDAPEAAGWVSASLLAIPEGVGERVPARVGASATRPAPTAQPQAPAGKLTARVFNGGNVRSAPNTKGRVLDQINAGETVELQARSADSAWFRISNTRGVVGWVHRSLLTIDRAVETSVPVAR
jgi:SH3-like domain-containing protein